MIRPLLALAILATPALANEPTATLQITATVVDESTIDSEDMRAFCEENGLMPSECMIDPNAVEIDDGEDG